jgi:flagellar biosynthesis protein FlhG
MNQHLPRAIMMFNSISTQAKNLVNLATKSKQNSKTKVVTITSGKGGVGKSTFTANIAYLLEIWL